MSHPFNAIGTKYVPHLQFTPNGQCFPLYRYTEKGERIENITDWGLAQFREHYSPNTKMLHSAQHDISKEDIFHYTYAVLHNSAYRKKYELNLKREFPRLPFYQDFWKWAAWGKALMELHVHYEDAKSFGLKVQNYEVKAEAKRQKKLFAGVMEPVYAHQPKVRVKLKADKEAGIIEIDELTFLTGVPKAAWEYKLGNRSALEWILDQYKEKETQGTDHRRKVQHLPVCRLQRTSDRAAAKSLHGER